MKYVTGNEPPRNSRVSRGFMVFVCAFSMTLFALAAANAGDTDSQEELPSGIEEVSLIPRDVLFDDPERSGVRLSPDGEYISYLAPVDGVRNVWVAPREEPDNARPVTEVSDRDIADYRWAMTGEHVLYSRDSGGNENFRIFSVHVETDERVALTPEEGVQARFELISPDHPEQIAVGLNERDPQLHDLYRIDITTGERELIYENEGFVSFLLDYDFNVRFGEAPAPGGGSTIMQREDGQWEEYAEVSLEDNLTTSTVGVDADGETLYMIDSRERDTAALTATDMATDETEVLYESPRADVSDALSDPETGRVQAAASNYKKPRWHTVDDGIESDLERLQEIADGEVEVLTRTLDDDLWLFADIVDDGPVEYYLYDRDEAEFLFTNEPRLEDQPLVPMHALTIETRDGLEMVSYLTLPPGVSGNDRAEGDGEDEVFDAPEDPLPMVLSVHGGPWGRDAWGLDPTHQWLANRGYAVLSVNFRGSTGFGKEFLNAGNLEWGEDMHDDLIDGVEWAVEQGIADPDKVAIMGASYGGYATLAGLTFTPDVFAAGVSIVGPSNLVTLLEAIPPYWEPQVEMFANRVGDHRTEEGRELLEERSPLNHVENIERPLLIGQGANDPRVPQEESDQIVEAMVEADIPVTYALYPDEGHGFASSENALSFNAVTEAFYAEHLGGRQEPVGDDFEGASLMIEEGVDYVPGVEEALE